MRFSTLAAAVVATAALCIPSLAAADDEDGDDRDTFSIAVIGDWPYSQGLLDNAHLLIDSVNDSDARLLIHLGDIHSGSMPCTSAGILPPLATSNPGWNQAVFHVFQQFRVPVVYTPGDNEWADCHKTKQFKSGQPLKELASVRDLFFAKPGRTLGFDEARVETQAEKFDQRYPADSQFVENVRFRRAGVVFATFNVPGGSNDDLSAWTNGFEDLTAHAREIAERQAANLRWLDAAFAKARRENARGIVIALQADMWDPEALASGGAGLDRYTPFVKRLADLAIAFKRPVLLLNGDSHVYLKDQPLADPTSTTGKIHRTPAVPNLTRIVVQGSTNAPAEWLKLTINRGPGPLFTTSNQVYCLSPGTGCL